MTQHEERVLACVDQSHFADHVADYGAWVARRLTLPLELLHVIDRHPEIASAPDHSGAIGIDAQEQLLSTLSEQDEARSRAAREQGRAFLARLRERAEAAGAAHTDTRQRHGELQETLSEQADNVRVFVLGRRGRSAEATQRDLGRNVERVVRGLGKPILAVTDSFSEPERALIAFDGSSLARRGVELVAASPLFRGMPIHLVMAGKLQRDAEKQVAWATGVLENAGFSTSTALLPGDTESVIAREIQARGSDILVMGAYSHSPLRSLFLGSKTTDLLRAARVPVLLLR
ncbi:universal stress protein [Pseudohaliea rubra]|uniref:Universal stress protein family 4 n=1 Tax=Pseudohaliea rubra DSM 19751 TaxID=1265313 RepID=A0A095X1B2_9GAMM|nr:universal stress protein [Pseudohaliea rubra]KGE04644.1 Universal stress protein family 4 [Pseudohaliea rubra DSM 19751]